MPSKRNWNIVRPDVDDLQRNVDAAAEISETTSLPADLQMMADQLADDAAHLAARYPTEMVRSAAEGPRWVPSGGSRLAAAVVFLAAVGGGLAIGWSLRGQPDKATVDSANRIVRAENSHEAAIPAIDNSVAPQAWHMTETESNRIGNPAGVQEVGFVAAPAVSPVRSELEMLRIQVTAFEQVIRKLQLELSRRETSQVETQLTVESLRQEVGQLRRQIDEQRNAEARK